MNTRLFQRHPCLRGRHTPPHTTHGHVRVHARHACREAQITPRVTVTNVLAVGWWRTSPGMQKRKNIRAAALPSFHVARMIRAFAVSTLGTPRSSSEKAEVPYSTEYNITHVVFQPPPAYHTDDSKKSKKKINQRFIARDSLNTRLPKVLPVYNTQQSRTSPPTPPTEVNPSWLSPPLTALRCWGVGLEVGLFNPQREAPLFV